LSAAVPALVSIASILGSTC